MPKEINTGNPFYSNSSKFSTILSSDWEVIQQIVIRMAYNPLMKKNNTGKVKKFILFNTDYG